MSLKHRLPYAALLSTLLSAGCFARYIEIDNHEGRVSSIGPVYEVEAGVYAVTISVADYEGDPVDVALSWRSGGGPWQEVERCPSSGLCSQTGLRALHSRERGEDSPHLLTLQGEGLSLDSLELRAHSTDDDERAIVWPSQAP